MANTTTLAPKLGFAYDLTGDNRTVLKVFIGQLRWNSADTLADQENPVGLAQLRYAFVSCSATVRPPAATSTATVWQLPAELGAFNSDAGRRRLRPCRSRPDPPDQQRGLAEPRARNHAGLSGRASWVYKNMRNVWGEIDVVRDAAYTVPFTIIDPGADRVVGTATTRRSRRWRSPVGHRRHDRVYTNPDERNNADFHTVEFAINRRFSGKWMMLTSFGYTWSTMAHSRRAARRHARSSIVRPT